MANRRSVFITGANGYIGSAVGQAFLRAGWHVYGLVRRPEAAQELSRDEIVPILGTLKDLSCLEQLYQHTKTIDVIVGATETYPGYAAHYHEAMTLVRALAKTSNDHGVRPLVLWTSGCKDYGVTDVDGAPGLAPHTEESPVKPSVEFLNQRATSCMKVFDNKDLFDGVVLRPTNVYGYGSSHFGAWFEVAAGLKATGDTLRLTISPRSIMHAMHVDDCGEAYVALAEHPRRSEIGGQAFNISSHAYETTRQVWSALEKDYGIEGQVQFVEPEDAGEQTPTSMALIFGYSQWVGSDKIRRVTGWTDKRMLFSENISVYHRAYEAAVSAKKDDVGKAEALKQFLNNLT